MVVAGQQGNDSSSSSSRRMLAHLLTVWLLGLDLRATGVPHSDPKEQSWHGQNLSSVPLDLDTRLGRLDLSNNSIRQLHTLGLPHLQWLDLSSNQLDLISERAFENLAQLEELNLASNALNNNVGSNGEALRSVSGLRRLDISMNGLSDDAAKLYLQNKPSLDRLKLTGNGLIKLTSDLFKESRGLRTICIDNNLITDIEQGTFEALTRLESLSLAKNNLVHICDFKLHQVRYLNLSRNSIEFFITLEDERLYMLEILDLSYNKLLYFPIIPKINGLRYLYLQNNMVGSMNAEETSILEANLLYEEVTSGEDNATERDNIYSNWRLMPLIYMDLSRNHFKSFPQETLSLLTSLETLDFSYNCLQNISCSITKNNTSACHRLPSFPSLRYFDLQSNGLIHISPVFLKALTQLETLNLQENSVKPCVPSNQSERSTSVRKTAKSDASCVDFGQIGTLKHLNLKDNGIKTLHPNTFDKTPLVSLNLARNSDMVVRAGALDDLRTSLQSLSISEVNMTSSDLSLPCMPALTHLNISHNRLNIIPSSLSCSPLRELDISHNIFVSLNHSLISDLSVHLNAVYISGNSFNCCSAKWWTILNEAMVRLPDIGRSECVTSDDNIILFTDYLKRPSMYCLPVTPEVTFGQVVIIMLFSTIISTILIIFIKKVCCQQESFVV